MAEPMKIRATLQVDTADVRILMQHPMETGQRKDAKGAIGGVSPAKLNDALRLKRVSVMRVGPDILVKGYLR